METGYLKLENLHKDVIQSSIMLQFLWFALLASVCASLTLGRLPVRCPGDSEERHCVEVGSTQVSSARKSQLELLGKCNPV